MHLRWPALVGVVGLVLASCGSGDGPPWSSAAPPQAPILLVNSDACGDAFFWAESESGDIAVTVTVNAKARSADLPTTIAFSLPNPAIDVEILTGRKLSRNFCTDLPDNASNPISTVTALTGIGKITLDPAKPLTEACGSTSGTLELEGLTTASGTTFEPIEVTSNTIGCYSG